MKYTDKKKSFETPELTIIAFTNDDIITESGGDFGLTGQGDTDVFPKQPNGWW